MYVASKSRNGRTCRDARATSTGNSYLTVEDRRGCLRDERAGVVTNLRSKQSASKRDQVQICVPSDRRYANDAQSAMIFARRLRLFAGRILCCCTPRLHLSCAALSPNKGAIASFALFFANLSGRFCAVCVSASSDGAFSTAPLARDTEGCHRTVSAVGLIFTHGHRLTLSSRHGGSLGRPC